VDLAGDVDVAVAMSSAAGRRQGRRTYWIGLGL
jgi:hypothetical protein